jgi:hypothetical protein
MTGENDRFSRTLRAAKAAVQAGDDVQPSPERLDAIGSECGFASLFAGRYNYLQASTGSK